MAETEDPAAQAEDAELLLLLESAIDDLGEVYRPVVTLHLRHDLSAQQIAEALGREPGTVRTQVVRGMSMLRKRLPASLVSLLLLQVLPAKGTEALRHVLMQRAAEVAAVRGSGVIAGSASVTSKLVAVVTALLLCCLAVFVDWSSTSVSSEDTAVLPSEANGDPVIDPLAGARDSGERETDARENLAMHRRFASLFLTVVDAEGGGAVSYLPLSVTRQSANPSLYTFCAVTDAQGRVAFDRLPAGRYHLPFSVQKTGLHMVDLRVGESRTLRVKGRVGELVRGVVVNRFGARVAGAELWSEGRVRRVVAKTDVRGGFLVRMHRRLRIRAASETAASEIVRVREPQDGPVRLTLTAPCPATTGRVIDGDGHAIAAAMVIVRQPAEALAGPPDPAWLTASDEDGLFVFTGIPRDGMWSVEAWTPGFGRATTSIIGPTDRSRIELVLPLAGRVTGRVTDPQGRGVGSAIIRVVDGNAQDGLFGCTVRSGPDGEYELTDISPGESIELRAISRNRPDWDLTEESPEMRIVRGRGVASRTIELTPGAGRIWNPILDPGHLIHGQIIDHLGEATTRLTVTLTTADGNDKIAQTDFTDREGGFRFVGLAQGRYTLLLDRRRGGERLKRVDDIVPRQEPYRIKIERGSKVGGRVVLSDGRPCVGAKVWLDAFDGSEFVHVPNCDTDREGRFELSEVPAGTRRVRVNYPEHAHLLTAEFVVGAGMTKELHDLRMHEGGRVMIIGPVQGPNLLNCVLIDASGHAVKLFPGKYEGGLRSDRLVPGRYRMIAQDVAPAGERPLGHKGFAPVARMIEIRDGEVSRFAFQPRPAVFVVIRVAERGKKPESASGRFIVAGKDGRTIVDDYLVRAPTGNHGVFGSSSSTLKFDESELRFGFFIGPGEYRVRVETKCGQVGTMKLSVANLTEEIEMQTLVVR